MKVLYVCSKVLRSDPTGAATQARETYAALQRLGCEMTRIYAGDRPGDFEDEAGKVITEAEVAALVQRNDLTHLIFCMLPIAKYWQRFVPHKPTVGSTVFWTGWERIAIAHRNLPFGLDRLMVELSWIRQSINWVNDFRVLDAFLPNTRAEGEKVLKCMRHRRGAFACPVANGFVAPNFDIHNLPRSSRVPSGDYIVVPAVFAPRKNQLGIIRALRDEPHQVVFMGGTIGTPQARWFYQQCRAAANERMHFLGFIPSNSEEYWQILAHAKCACLASDCETPGIAMLEAAYAGVRPVITRFGGTEEYFGSDGEYFNPADEREIRDAIKRGIARGPLTRSQSDAYLRFNWDLCARQTLSAYQQVLAT